MNVVTSLLGLVIVSHLSPKGSGRFTLSSRWLSLLSMGTPDSPVVHRTLYCSLSGACHVSWPLGFGVVDRWSPLSSCGTGQSGGTPESPMCSNFSVLTSDFCTVYYSRSQRIRPLGELTVAPLAHRTVRWIIVEWLWENPRATWDKTPNSGVPWPGHRTVSGVPLAAPNSVFAPNFVEFPDSLFLLVYVELYAPEIKHN
jgi:hypothetical protein